MNESLAELENRIAHQRATLPDSLRADVEAVVKQSVRKETTRDDIRWLAICFGVLFAVVAAQWCMLQRSSQKLQDFSETAIASTEDAKRIVALLSDGGSYLPPPIEADANRD